MIEEGKKALHYAHGKA